MRHNLPVEVAVLGATGIAGHKILTYLAQSSLCKPTYLAAGHAVESLGEAWYRHAPSYMGRKHCDRFGLILPKEFENIPVRDLGHFEKLKPEHRPSYNFCTLPNREAEGGTIRKNAGMPILMSEPTQDENWDLIFTTLTDNLGRGAAGSSMVLLEMIVLKDLGILDYKEFLPLQYGF